MEKNKKGIIIRTATSTLIGFIVGGAVFSVTDKKKISYKHVNIDYTVTQPDEELDVVGWSSTVLSDKRILPGVGIENGFLISVDSNSKKIDAILVDETYQQTARKSAILTDFQKFEQLNLEKLIESSNSKKVSILAHYTIPTETENNKALPIAVASGVGALTAAAGISVYQEKRRKALVKRK